MLPSVLSSYNVSFALKTKEPFVFFDGDFSSGTRPDRDLRTQYAWPQYPSTALPPASRDLARRTPENGEKRTEEVPLRTGF
jgi:hypothetical protein